MDVLVANTPDEWSTVVSGCFVPLDCAATESTFRGRMEYARMDESVAISVVTTDGTTADRTPRHASRANNDDLHISLQRRSRGVVTQNGRATRVAPGSVTIYATDAPYYLDYSAPDQQQEILQISRRSLRLPAPLVADACRRLLVPQDTATRTLFGFVQDVRTSGSAVTDPQVAAVVRDLTATMIQSSFSSGRVMPRTSRALRVTVQDFMKRHYRRDALTMAEVADAHFISRRRLYQVFDDVATTPADYLRELRLEEVARLLADVSTHRTIATIARESGFGDATTLTRAFRRQFGTTPHEYRAQGNPFAGSEAWAGPGARG